MCIYVNGYIYVNENNLCGYKKQDKFEGEESCGQTDIQEEEIGEDNNDTMPIAT